MTVTEVTTSIAIVSGVTFVGLLLLPQRLGRGAAERPPGRFTVSAVPVLGEPSFSPGDGLRRPGRGGTRLFTLALLAVVSGIAVGVSISLLLVLTRDTIGLGAG